MTRFTIKLKSCCNRPTDYLSSVMDDLGVKMTSDLVDLGKLMKMFPEITDGTTVDRVSPRLLSVVKKMKTRSVT